MTGTSRLPPECFSIRSSSALSDLTFRYSTEYPFAAICFRAALV